LPLSAVNVFQAFDALKHVTAKGCSIVKAVKVCQTFHAFQAVTAKRCCVVNAVEVFQAFNTALKVIHAVSVTAVNWCALNASSSIADLSTITIHIIAAIGVAQAIDTALAEFIAIPVTAVYISTRNADTSFRTAGFYAVAVHAIDAVRISNAGLFQSGCVRTECKQQKCKPDQTQCKFLHSHSFREINRTIRCSAIFTQKNFPLTITRAISDNNPRFKADTLLLQCTRH
jgi:hypothetical protein